MRILMRRRRRRRLVRRAHRRPARLLRARSSSPTTTSPAPRRWSRASATRASPPRRSTPPTRTPWPTSPASTAITHVLNVVDPRFVLSIFEGAFLAGAHYLDTAMSLSSKHPEQSVRAARREARRRPVRARRRVEGAPAASRCAASASSPVSPTCSRGTPPTTCSARSTSSACATPSNLVVHGYDFAPSFSIWTTIEECLNPPVIWEKDKGWFTTEPFSEPEVFDFPGRHRPGRVRQRGARGGAPHAALGRRPAASRSSSASATSSSTSSRRCNKLGLDRTEKVRVRGTTGQPARRRRRVPARPAHPRRQDDRQDLRRPARSPARAPTAPTARVYLYHVADNEWTMQEYGAQAVVWQTAMNPVVALELLATGAWTGAGVLGPEAFDERAVPRPAQATATARSGSSRSATRSRTPRSVADPGVRRPARARGPLPEGSGPRSFWTVGSELADVDVGGDEDLVDDVDDAVGGRRRRSR